MRKRWPENILIGQVLQCLEMAVLLLEDTVVHLTDKAVFGTERGTLSLPGTSLKLDNSPGIRRSRFLCRSEVV